VIIWPYGIEGSRKTLEAFQLFCDEQGATWRKLTPEDLFVPETQTSFKI